MKKKISSFRDLNIWNMSIDLVKDVYILTNSFPKEEKYAIISQMRRAVVSIPSNISEGFGRKYNKEFKQFLNIAVGSCCELETQIEISNRVKYIDDSKKNELIDRINHIKSMILSLIKKLK